MTLGLTSLQRHLRQSPTHSPNTYSQGPFGCQAPLCTLGRMVDAEREFQPQEMDIPSVTYQR